MNDSPYQKDPVNQSLRVAYVLWRFPELSHTFVTSEVLALRQRGVRVPVFSLLSARDQVRSESSRQVCAQDTYYPRLTSMLSLNAQALITHWCGYLQAGSAFLNVCQMGSRAITRAIALFPRCVEIGMLCKRMGMSHVHTHWPGLPVFAAQVVASIAEVPFSFTIHTPQDAESPETAHQLRKASFVRCDTRLGQRLLQSRMPGAGPKLKMVRSINPNPLTNHAKADNNYILAAARLIPMKGITYLIHACAILKKRGLNFHCIVIGDGPLRESLIQETISLGVEGSVVLMGPLPHERYIEYLSECSMFVMPSILGAKGVESTDGLPTVILEAMSMGKPVVATDAGAISEVVIEGVTGLMVPQHDAKSLADALEKLLLNIEVRQNLGKNGLTLSQTEFDSQKVGTQLLNLFRNYSARCN